MLPLVSPMRPPSLSLLMHCRSREEPVFSYFPPVRMCVLSGWCVLSVDGVYCLLSLFCACVLSDTAVYDVLNNTLLHACYSPCACVTVAHAEQLVSEVTASPQYAAVIVALEELKVKAAPVIDDAKSHVIAAHGKVHAAIAAQLQTVRIVRSLVQRPAVVFVAGRQVCMGGVSWSSWWQG